MNDTATKTTASADAAVPDIPPMFTPLTLRGMTVANRIVMSPMCMYSAEDGTVNDLHPVHLCSPPMGRPRLVLTRSTDAPRLTTAGTRHNRERAPPATAATRVAESHSRMPSLVRSMDTAVRFV